MEYYYSYKKCREKVESKGYNWERILMLARVLTSVKKELERKKKWGGIKGRKVSKKCLNF